MKKSILYVAIIQLILSHFALADANDNVVVNPYSQKFNAAYVANPSIPRGVLEAVSYTQTRFVHITASYDSSCAGLPKAYSVMGLIDNGQGYFRDNLYTVAQLSGISRNAIKSSPDTSIMAYANAFAVLQQQYNTYGNNIEDYQTIFLALSELPLTTDIQNDYALNSHFYQLYWFLNNTDFQEAYNFPSYQINMQQIFGSNYSVLSSSQVNISSQSIQGSNGSSYNNTGLAASVLSSDYSGAIWNATTCNYSSRSGTAITAIAIHTIQGSYAGCISWFKNCSANASAHYVVRSSDGQVTQMILESNKAWHLKTESAYTIGIEHEGYVADGNLWYTTALYTASSGIVRDICNSGYGISALRCYDGPGCTGSTPTCGLGSCIKVKGHQHFPSQNHTDPGIYWNWARFYKLVNNSPTITTVSTATGAFYDTGGASANYQDDERKLWLFAPTGAASVTVTFSAFDVESGYDKMLIYDGNSVNATLIGEFTGTQNPGTITSTGPSLLVEFRSDCATSKPGWAAIYTSGGTGTGTTTVVDVVAPNTQINAPSSWQTSNFSSTYVDADNSGGSGVKTGFYLISDYNGTEWRANGNNGFFADDFGTAIHPEWTNKTGTWNITSQALVQTEETTTNAANTNIYAAVNQNSNSRFLYHFKGKIGGTGTARRAGFHFFCDNPDSSNRGNSYFVWFRVDNQKIQIYETVNNTSGNTFGSPKVDVTYAFNANQWYDYKVIYDKATGKIDVYVNDVLSASWTDTTPLTLGSHISFRSGNAIWSVDELAVYRSRSTTTPISIGSANTNDVRYQNPSPTQNACKVKSLCVDSASNLSTISVSNINIDWTAPSTVSVNDGPSTDINTVNSVTTLEANWTASTDAHSGLAKYWYSIGTTPGGTNVSPWTSNSTNSSISVNGLTLKQDTTYYINVKVENGAGLFSTVTSSNGQKVDTTSSTIGVNELENAYQLAVYPNPTKDILTVKLNLSKEANLNITLLDMLGKEVSLVPTQNKLIGEFNQSFNLTQFNLAKGIYMLKLSIDNRILVKKVVVN